MPVGYGTTTQVTGLLSSEIGREQTIKSTSGWISFLRILITIGEIAAAFIPGIGVVAETGISLAAGAANEALDVASGNVSATGTLLNLATPFIGGAFAGRANLRQIGRVLENVESAADTAALLGRGLSGVESAILSGDRRIVGGAFSQFNTGVRGLESRVADTTLSGLHLGREGVKKVIDNLSVYAAKSGDNIIREATEDKRFNDFLKKSGLSDAAILDLKRTMRMSGRVEDQTSLLIAWIRELGARDVVQLYRNATGEIEEVLLNEAWAVPFAKKAVGEFNIAVQKLTLNSKALAAKAQTFDSYWKEVRYKLFQDKSKPFYKRLTEVTGSAKFNEKVVQKGQLIDPNDLGRAPIEALYQKLKAKIGKYFRGLYKLLDEAEDVEDAWVKSGGVTMDSDWIMGYKVVRDLGINKQVILIKFDQGATKGKHDVMAIASDVDLVKFKERPGDYYLERWALSRGGKSLGMNSFMGMMGSAKGVSRQAISVLGFLPVNALRNVLSLVSNWVENVTDMVKGEYLKNYDKKLIHSFTNTAISRTFRLAGRVIGGNAAGYAASKFLKTYYQKVGIEIGKRIGNVIGRELQRVGTQILAKGIKNVMAGNSFDKNLGNQALTGALTSMRSHGLRNLRHRNPNSVVAQGLSARRKLYQFNRIPNAVMPRRPFSGIKL